MKLAIRPDARGANVFLDRLWRKLSSSEVNKRLADAEYRKGVLKVKSTPVIVSLESTSRCNLRCVMCDHVIGAVDRPKHLHDGIVEKMRLFLGRASEITLHGIGEPTNSPAFWKILPDLPSRDNCQTVVNSNFAAVTIEQIENLVTSNMSRINVSLDAATEQTYRRIRGFSFAAVIGNIEKFLAIRRERGLTYPHLHINMTLMRSNIDEVSDFVQVAHRLGVDYAEMWHLNHWSDEHMARFVIERDGWTFDYAREGLWNFPTLSNRRIREAVALAKKLSVPLYLDHNKSVFFDE